MKKNIRLADIYVRIYNKRPLTLDDLVFLSKYDRECFEKTYQNVMYTLADAGGQKKPAVMDEKSVKECGPDTEKAENEQRTEKSEKPDAGSIWLLEKLEKSNEKETKGWLIALLCTMAGITFHLAAWQFGFSFGMERPILWALC